MKKALQIVLIFVLTVALALGVLSACTPENDNPAHECTSKCDVCGGCKNASCQEDVCKSKCTCKEAPQEYTVTFDLAGGECAVDVASGVKVTAGAELDLSAYAVTKQHHTFIGWTDGSSEYAADAKITVNANLTLTAKWQQNTYAVTFDLAGGTCSKDVSEDVKVLAGTELKLSSYVVTKEGHTFAGWTDGTNDYATDGTLTVNGNVTLTAKWTINVYSVMVDVNGGSALETASVSVNSGDQIDLANYVTTKTNYVLAGWSDGETVHSTDAKITVTSNITLTAVWNLATTDESVFTVEEAEGGVCVGLVKDCELTTIIVPKQIGGRNVVKIGMRGFSYNNKIEEVYLDAATEIVEIESNAFSGSKNLRFVSLKGLSKLTTLGDSVFYGIYDNTTYKGASLQTVDFSGCTSLKTIGQMAFAYQYTLQNIDLSECTSLTSIDRNAFDYCVVLKSVKLPASLQTIGSDFFRGCSALENIEVTAGGIGFESENDMLYTVGKTEIIKLPAKSTMKDYVAPATVTKIWAQAFAGVTSLETIDLSACTKINSVGFSAFDGCSNATITVPFTSDGRLESGASVSLGSSWASGVSKVNYQNYTFVELTVSGLKNNQVVSEANAELAASATYGSESLPVTVKLNGAEVSATDGVFQLTFVLGENTIEISASYGEKTASQTIKVTYKNKPVVSSTVEDGTVYYGDTIEFDVIAKTAAGEVLTASDVSVQLNFGSTWNVPFMGLTVSDAIGGKVHVVIAIADLIDMGFFDGGQFGIRVIASDGGVTAELTYTVVHKDGPAPVATITSTLEDGKTYYGSIEFDITATDASGNSLDKDGVEVGLKFSDSPSYFVPFMGYTIANGSDGKVHVVYDMASLYSMYFFDSDFSIRIAVKGSDVEVIYNVTWLEGEEPKASVTSTLEDGKTYNGGSIEFDITATDASGNSLDKDGVEVGLKFSDSPNYFVPFMGYTITNGDNGKIHVVYDMASLYSMYFFDSDFSIRIAIKGSDVEVIYNVTWLEA